MTKRKRNVIIILSVILFSAFFITVACTGFEYVNNKNKMRTVYSYDGNFEVQLPDSMDFIPTRGELNKDACFEICDEYDRYYMVTFVEPFKEYSDRGIDMNYEKYVDMYIDSMIKPLSADIGEVNEFVTTDSRKLKYVEFESTVNSNSVHYTAYFFQTQNNYAVMIFYSLPEHQQYLKTLSEDIVPTFKEKGQQTVASM